MKDTKRYDWEPTVTSAPRPGTETGQTDTPPILIRYNATKDQNTPLYKNLELIGVVFLILTPSDYIKNRDAKGVHVGVAL